MAEVPLFTAPLSLEALQRAIFELRISLQELRGQLASLEIRFDGSEVKKRADGLRAVTEQLTMDAEKAIRVLLAAAGKTVA